TWPPEHTATRPISSVWSNSQQSCSARISVPPTRSTALIASSPRELLALTLTQPHRHGIGSKVTCHGRHPDAGGVGPMPPIAIRVGGGLAGRRSGRGVAGPGWPGAQVWSFENPGVEVVADLLGDQVLELGAVFGDQVLMGGVERQVAHLGRIRLAVVEHHV